MQLKSELVAGYMDDLTLGGPTDVVAADIDHITARKKQTGLHINAAKCEIISHSPAPRTSQSAASSFWRPIKRSFWEDRFSLGAKWMLPWPVVVQDSTLQLTAYLCCLHMMH